MLPNAQESEIREFITDKYGPSVHEILKSIQEENEKSGHSEDVSVEEVQRMKEMIPKVGSLEFRILANKNDDDQALQETLELINKKGLNDPEIAAALKYARERSSRRPMEVDPANRQGSTQAV